MNRAELDAGLAEHPSFPAYVIAPVDVSVPEGQRGVGLDGA